MFQLFRVDGNVSRREPLKRERIRFEVHNHAIIFYFFLVASMYVSLLHIVSSPLSKYVPPSS